MRYVISDRCVKCGACESECPNSAIVEDAPQYRINPLACVACGTCAQVCPNDAIDVTEEPEA